MIPCFHIWSCLYIWEFSLLCCWSSVSTPKKEGAEWKQKKTNHVFSRPPPPLLTVNILPIEPTTYKAFIIHVYYLIYKEDAVMCVYWVPHGTFVCVLSADTCSVLLHQSMWEEVRCVQGASLPSRTASSCASMNCPGMRRVSSARYVAARWAGPATAGTACFTASTIMRSKTV